MIPYLEANLTKIGITEEYGNFSNSNIMDRP